MSLEDVCTVETLLRCATTARAEATDHRSLVMGKSMTVLVVLSCEAFGMVLAGYHRTLLWSLVLMRKHMSLQILDIPSTGGDGTEALV